MIHKKTSVHTIDSAHHDPPRVVEHGLRGFPQKIHPSILHCQRYHPTPCELDAFVATGADDRGHEAIREIPAETAADGSTRMRTLACMLLLVLSGCTVTRSL